MAVRVGQFSYHAGPSAPAGRRPAQGKRWLHRRSWRLQVGPSQGRRAGSPTPSTAVAQRSLGKRHAHLSGRSPAMPPPGSQARLPARKPLPAAWGAPSRLDRWGQPCAPGTLQRLTGGQSGWSHGFITPQTPKGASTPIGQRRSRTEQHTAHPPQPPPRRGAVRWHR